MILENLHLMGADSKGTVTVAAAGYSSSLAISFDDAIAFPGLINSHDHLEMNLFPPLKNNSYTNYMQWGTDIHVAHKDSIQSILKIPLSLRIAWGAYKNLLNGITTVVHHGKKIEDAQLPVQVFQRCTNLHSVGQERHWRRQLQLMPFKRTPFVIHIGEGTDDNAAKEIDRYIQQNYFNRRTIGIHGIAMTAEQAKRFSALVWCPASNYFLFNTTAAIDLLKNNTTILFGTDATVSSSWSIWDHLRMARDTKLLDDKALFNTVTATAATTWGIFNNDIVVAKRKDKDNFNSFFSLLPEDILLITRDGKIVLYDECLQPQLQNKINPNHLIKYTLLTLESLCQEVYAS